MKNERTFTRLNVTEAKALLKTRPRIYDARDEQSFAESCIEGATLLNRASLNNALLQSPKQAPVLIYCYRGNASQEYGQMFADFGFTQVYDLIDGYEAWRRHAANASGAADDLSPVLREWLARHGFQALDGTIANATTPLMHGARHGEVAIVRELISLRVPLEPLNLDGNNALWLACFSGSLAVIDLLIAAGIAIDHQNHNGATCLMYAASAGKTEVVARLLAAGANTALPSLDDFSALDMAANVECLNLLRAARRRNGETA